MAGMGEGLIVSPTLHMLTRYPASSKENALKRLEIFQVLGTIIGPIIMLFSSNLKQIWIYHLLGSLTLLLLLASSCIFHRASKQ